MLRWRGKSNRMCAGKLAVDFAVALRLSGHMDDDTRYLIVQLCTRAGMVMEDATVIALSAARQRDDAALRKDLEELSQAGQVIFACINAASELAR